MKLQTFILGTAAILACISPTSCAPLAGYSLAFRGDGSAILTTPPHGAGLSAK